ncbi:MAG: DUF2723 domain-containing protein [Elusimicrobia bacterium]|nr:DUF2723 domain-containing protein [Candidatus Liberimonas magnetica]
MPLLIFFSSFLLYLSTLAPSITVGDSGEFCASSVILGLPHSPGYPLYCLLGKVFTLLIPFGSFAFRLNLMSAFFGSVCLVILYIVLLELGKNYRPALAGGLIPEDNKKEKIIALFSVLYLGVSSAFWHSAIQSEVFTLNALFVAMLFYSFIKEKYYLCAYIFGLGLGNHHTLIFLGPLFIIALKQSRSFNIKTLALFTLFFFIGFSVYLYLPVRSAKNPALDWGHPETLHNLWRVISRADYGSLSLSVGEKLPRNLVTVFQQLLRFFKVLSGEFTYAGVFLGIFGWVIAVKNRYGYSKTLLFLSLLTGPGFILLSNMQFDSQSEGILERFYLIVNIFWMFPIMWSLDYIMMEVYYLLNRGKGNDLTQSLVISRKWVYSFASLIFICLIYFAANSYSSSNWRDYYLAYDYGRNIQRTLPKNAVFFMDGGDDTFYSMAYLSFANRQRQDLELHDRGGLVFKSIYGTDFRSLTKQDKELRRNKVEQEFYLNRNIYYSTFNRDVLPGVKLVADGMLYRPLVSPPKYKVVTAEPVGKDSWPMYSLRGIYGRKYYDYRSNALAPVYPYFEAFRSKDKLMLWKYIYNRWAYVLWVKDNIRYEIINYAFQTFERNLLEESENMYKAVLSLFPDEVSAFVNLGVIAEKKRDFAGSKEWYRKALDMNPKNMDALYNLAVLYWKEENWSEVVKNLKRMLEVKPDDQRARYYLPLAIAKMNKNEMQQRNR